MFLPTIGIDSSVHLIFSSEPLSGENVWNEMKPGEVVGVDWRMRLHQGSVEEGARPVVQ